MQQMSMVRVPWRSKELVDRYILILMIEKSENYLPSLVV